jgi:uncharacterized membrane protein
VSGAVAIALSGAFFVKYAIDHDLLGPAARVSLGVALGFALAAGGEWLRRRPLSRTIAAVRPDYVPPALTSSGLFMMFVSVYASYSVYALLNPLVAFAFLALVAVFGIGLSLWQGPFVALLGLLGAFVAPALVATPHPSVWGLFGYLLVIEIACLGVVRYRAWWWLAFAALAGVATWPLLWQMGGHFHIADALPVGLYLTLSAASFFVLPAGLDPTLPRERFGEEMAHLALPEKAVLIAGAVIAFDFFLLVGSAAHSETALALFGIAIVLYLAAGWRRPSVEALAIVAGAAALAVIASMQVPLAAPPPPVPPMYPALLAAEHVALATASFSYGALFAIGGFAFLWGGRRPGIWAGVSAAMPVLLLVVAYWRFDDFAVSPQWAVGALALALVELFAVERVARHRGARGLDVSLGMYAAGVVALISLAATMMLREAWLTVALSLQLPAVAFIRRRVPVRALDAIAFAIAATVLVRLVFNYNVLGYPYGEDYLVTWIAYGYGIPAVAFFVASRLYREAKVDALQILLEAGALAFAVLFFSLQLRYYITGSIETFHYSLIEQSAQSIVWLVIGGGLAAIAEKSVVARIGARILLGGAAGQIFFLQLLISNPLWSDEAIVGPPFFDSLLLAYAIPAVFCFWLASDVRKRAGAPIVHAAGGAGFVLLLVYISLEVRRFFHGALLASPGFADAEMYSYSIAWLAYAAVLLGIGMFLRQSTIRYAALAMLALTSGKVFLFDMSGLTGLYRATSFLGLGLSLVAIGFLYQRFVVARPPP